MYRTAIATWLLLCAAVGGQQLSTLSNNTARIIPFINAGPGNATSNAAFTYSGQQGGPGGLSPFINTKFISYRQGSVMTGETLNAYIVFYGAKTGIFNYFTAAKRQVIIDFVNAMSTTAWFEVGRQYGTARHVRVAKVVDINCFQSEFAASCAIGERQVEKILYTQMFTVPDMGAASPEMKAKLDLLGYGLPKDPNGFYLVIGAPETTEMLHSQDGQIKVGRDYCGYHSTLTAQSIFPNSTDTNVYKYGYIEVPNMHPINISSIINTTLSGPMKPASRCFFDRNKVASPNGDPQIDMAVSIIGHEIIEILVSPHPRMTYIDDDGNELMDKCETWFNELRNIDGYDYNLQAGARRFLVSPVWDLKSQKCAMSPSETFLDPCDNVRNDTLSSLVSVACLQKTWLSVGCTTSGTQYPNFGYNGDWRNVAVFTTFQHVRQDMLNWSRSNSTFHIRGCRDPCAGLTDSSPASTVPITCLQVTWLAAGCTTAGSSYPGDKYTGWWLDDNGAGNFGGIKKNILSWAKSTSNDHIRACRDPCVTLADDAPASTVPVACLQNIWFASGCSQVGTEFPTDDYRGWWLQDTGARTFKGIKDDMRLWGTTTNIGYVRGCRNPCAGLTDSSPADTVPIACIQKVWGDSGCTSYGTAFPKADYAGWWTSNSGAGTFKGIKDDMRVWGSSNEGWRIRGCRDACQGLTDSSPAATVSVACLQQIWGSFGCTSLGISYPKDGYVGWWTNNSDAGTFKGIKDDMKLWRTSSEGWRVRGCRDPCSGVSDTTPASTIPIFCLQNVWASSGCNSIGTQYPTDDYRGWWLQDTGAKTFKGVKDDMRVWGTSTNIGRLRGCKDPCAGLTDSSPADTVPVACIQKVWRDSGCTSYGTAFPKADYTGWWTSNSGAGTFKGIKDDMRVWGSSNEGWRIRGCRDACQGLTDSSPADTVSVACLQQIWGNYRCTSAGTQYPRDGYVGWWNSKSGAGTLKGIKDDMQLWGNSRDGWRIRGCRNPCSALTDTSPADTVSTACLQKVWFDSGCTSEGTDYPNDNYQGWWTQNGGAGTFKGIKDDMKLWATSPESWRIRGCRNPCSTLSDTSPADTVSIACLQKVWFDSGCTGDGTAYPKDGYVGWWISNSGAGTLKGIKDDMKKWGSSTDNGRIRGCRDPCSGLTDSSPAATVSVACLQKLWMDSGCSAAAFAYPQDGYVGWWNSNTGAGTLKAIKDDMTMWAASNDSWRIRGCHNL